MPFSVESVRMVARRHGVTEEPELMPSGGMVNEAWALGSALVLRIIRDPEGDGEAARETMVVPLVRQAGLPTPALVEADLSCDLLPRPYTVYERASGLLLGYLQDDPKDFGDLYRTLGEHLARLNALAVPSDLAPLLRRKDLELEASPVPRAVATGLLTSVEADDVTAWLERLVAAGGEASALSLIHADAHPWNLFADPATRRLTAIIDWGDTSWGDPATELSSMPYCAVPDMIEGYRRGGGKTDGPLVARSLLHGLRLGLWELRALDPALFDRRWWRMPPGGWEEARCCLADLYQTYVAS
jgi:hygromycin-B 7''-O-kinase